MAVKITVLIEFAPGTGWDDLDGSEWADNFELVARDTYGATWATAHATVSQENES